MDRSNVKWERFCSETKLEEMAAASATPEFKEGAWSGIWRYFGYEGEPLTQQHRCV